MESGAGAGVGVNGVGVSGVIGVDAGGVNVGGGKQMLLLFQG